MWSTMKLKQRVDKKLYELDDDNWEVISVAFGINVAWIVTAFITVVKKD